MEPSIPRSNLREKGLQAIELAISTLKKHKKTGQTSVKLLTPETLAWSNSNRESIFGGFATAKRLLRVERKAISLDTEVRIGYQYLYRVRTPMQFCVSIPRAQK
jgi:hypothetical protein